MSPVLDSIGSVKGYGWGSFSSPTAFDSIATIIPNGTSSSVTFSNIPQTYRSLQIRFISKNAETSSMQRQINLTTDNSTASNNNATQIGADGSGNNIGPFNQLLTNYVGIKGATLTSASGLTNLFGCGIIDIYDYTSTAINKTFRWVTGNEANSNSPLDYCLFFGGGSIGSTSAITSITLSDVAASNFTTTSAFALYGIKGS